MELMGIHHVTAITADIRKNYSFYTEVLGMRLVKKTVNHDDTSVYHLFYADETGSPGTGLTFFEMPEAEAAYPGVSSISRISLRVPNNDALLYWKDRLDEHKVDHDSITKEAGRKILNFRDPEGLCIALVSDEKNIGVEGGKPWEASNVPTDKAITGLGPSTITVTNPASTITILTRLLTFKQVGSYPSPNKGQDPILIFSTGEGGTGAEIHLETRSDLPQEEEGYGSLHHLSLRVGDNEELRKWKDYLDKARMPNSGLVDRFYFRSVYFREPNGILIELATDEPGFMVDEDLDSLGESLSLPPDLDSKRERIEEQLVPFDTVRSNK